MAFSFARVLRMGVSSSLIRAAALATTRTGHAAAARAVAASGPAIARPGGARASLSSSTTCDSDYEPTIFDQIISGDIPANVLHEDDACLAFADVSPQAPTHFLVIPKHRAGLTQLSKATEGDKELLGHLLYTAQKVARQQQLDEEGFRVVINDGPAGCQSVYHLHLHVLGGRQMLWPPG